VTSARDLAVELADLVARDQPRMSLGDAPPLLDLGADLVGALTVAKPRVMIFSRSSSDFEPSDFTSETFSWTNASIMAATSGS
jgi:hypothetical protein